VVEFNHHYKLHDGVIWNVFGNIQGVVHQIWWATVIMVIVAVELDRVRVHDQRCDFDCLLGNVSTLAKSH